MKKFLALMLMAALALGLLTSAGVAEGASSAITVVLSEVGNNLDPIIANFIDTSTMTGHIYDNLLHVDTEFSFIPGVASAWNQPDSTTVELTMGEGFVFHDGEALEMEDFMYALERLENIAEMASVWTQIESISADGNVMTIKIKEPNNSFMRSLAEIPVLNKSYCESAGEGYANAPIGTGPYKVANYIPGERLVLEAWADYPFEKAIIPQITFIGISENAAKYMAIEAGDAQLSQVSYADFQRAQGNDKINTFEGPTTSTSFVSMNVTTAPFDDVNVRLAMAYAYNKEGYKNLAAYSTFSIDSMFLLDSEYYHSSEYAISYNPEKAKELLEAAGYDENNPLGFVVAGYGGENPIMQAYQADLMAIGVNVELENYEFGTFLNLMMNQEYQMLTGSWGNVVGDPLSSAACYWTGSYGSQNISFFENARCDELYNLALVSTDQSEILAACMEIQDIAWQQAPIFPTFGRYQSFAFDKDLTDMIISPSGIISFRTATYAK